MKHRHSMRKLGRTSSHRWALLRNLVSQLVQHERLETTVPKGTLAAR
jgi:large subunit ribosomal protein L17